MGGEPIMVVERQPVEPASSMPSARTLLIVAAAALLLWLLMRGKGSGSAAPVVGAVVLRGSIKVDRVQFVGGPLLPVETVPIPTAATPDARIELDVTGATERAWRIFDERAREKGWNCISTDNSDTMRCGVMR